MMPDRDLVMEAARRVAPWVRRTPVARVESDRLPGPLTLKLELLQLTGSFKARGAFNALLAEGGDGAVATASGGNHGAAVALAGRRLGRQVTVFVPETAAPVKIDRLRGYGARVEVVGHDYAEAKAACDEHARRAGARSVHAYDELHVVAGQGTAAAEFEEQAPDLDTVVVAVGGGGLIGGFAACLGGRMRIVGVETAGTASMGAALRAGGPVDVEVLGLAADSLGARRAGRFGFDLVRRHGCQLVEVSDADVRDAQRFLWNELRIAAEPGGAAALSALLAGAWTPEPGARVGVLVCGGNVDPRTLADS